MLEVLLYFFPFAELLVNTHLQSFTSYIYRLPILNLACMKHMLHRKMESATVKAGTNLWLF